MEKITPSELNCDAAFEKDDEASEMFAEQLANLLWQQWMSRKNEKDV